MRYDDIHPTLRAYISVHDALRRLGFRSEDIFFACGDPQNLVHCVLRTQGKQFVVTCGEGFSGVEDEWVRVATSLVANELPDEDFQRIWDEGAENVTGLVFMLVQRGFFLPRHTN